MNGAELMNLYRSTQGRVVIENKILGDHVDTFFEEIDTLRKFTAFINCQISQLSIDSIRTVDSLLFVGCEIGYLDTRGSYFGGYLEITNNILDHINLFDSEFNTSVHINNRELNMARFDGNTFRNIPTQVVLNSEKNNDLFKKPTPFRNQLFLGSSTPIGEVMLSNNTFESEDFFQTVQVSAEIGRLVIRGNSFQSTLDLDQTTISNQFMLFGNSINRISFGYMTFSETYNLIEWDDLQSFRILQTTRRDLDLFTLKDEDQSLLKAQLNYLDPRAFYEAQSKIELDYQPLYDDLIRNYYALYLSSKQFGNIRYANGINYEMKEIEGRWLRNQYLNKPTFSNYFKWKLNRLMGFYTAHGTDPAKSVMISLLIILVFGVFYFFFPSDWDKESKATMILRFKELIAKDGVYVKPFFVLFWAILLSLVNGLTLSLNSFITLGFGQIPTHGLAKYACIVEGFLGWFLLTLFTVTLINQIQF